MRLLKLKSIPTSLDYSSLPTLAISGTLPPYRTRRAYNNALNIENSVGKLSAKLISGQLPPGTDIVVNQQDKTVSIIWSAYAVGNITLSSNLAEWKCKHGWQVVNNSYFSYCGAGKSYVFSPPIPKKQDAIITFSCLLQILNASGNTPVYLVFAECDNLGNVVNIIPLLSSYTYKSTSAGTWLYVEASSTFFGSVGRIGVCANSKHQPNIKIKNIECTYITEVGANSDTDYPLTIEVIDGLNRIATWSGVIKSGYTYLTSQLYPITVSTQTMKIGVPSSVFDLFKDGQKTIAESAAIMNLPGVASITKISLVKKLPASPKSVASIGMPGIASLEKERLVIKVDNIAPQIAYLGVPQISSIIKTAIVIKTHPVTGNIAQITYPSVLAITKEIA